MQDVSIKHISAEEIAEMAGMDGLILQGCGGDPGEWVSGINELLTQEGILLNGDGLLPRCDDVITLQGKYTPDCMHKRNRYMVDRANHLLAVYDGSGKGGTAYTVHYAQRKRRQILTIHPETLGVASGADFEGLKEQRQISVFPKQKRL
jgi:hypothetical protein